MIIGIRVRMEQIRCMNNRNGGSFLIVFVSLLNGFLQMHPGSQ